MPPWSKSTFRFRFGVDFWSEHSNLLVTSPTMCIVYVAVPGPAPFDGRQKQRSNQRTRFFFFAYLEFNPMGDEERTNARHAAPPSLRSLCWELVNSWRCAAAAAWQGRRPKQGLTAV